MKQAFSVGSSYIIYAPAYSGYPAFLHMRHPNTAGTLENFMCFLDHGEFFEMYWPELSQSEVYLKYIYVF